jgi:hypothetical protein
MQQVYIIPDTGGVPKQLTFYPSRGPLPARCGVSVGTVLSSIGQVFVPDVACDSTTGQWVTQGHGVDPDILVENEPASVIAGHDPHLERR